MAQSLGTRAIGNAVRIAGARRLGNDYRFYHPVGINNASTFLIGLYTQPLGFLLLITLHSGDPTLVLYKVNRLSLLSLAAKFSLTRFSFEYISLNDSGPALCSARNKPASS